MSRPHGRTLAQDIRLLEAEIALTEQAAKDEKDGFGTFSRQLDRMDIRMTQLRAEEHRLAIAATEELVKAKRQQEFEKNYKITLSYKTKRRRKKR